MPSLVCHHISFAWPTGEVVLADLDASFPDGRTGLIGSNGVGKSTLLRVLAGEISPTAGSVSGPETIGYLPQDLALDQMSSVAELLGIAGVLAALARVTAGTGGAADLDQVSDAWDIEERTQAVLADLGFVELNLTRPLRTLSGGEVMLLALAAHLLARPDVLILDEPTNNLDRAGRARLRGALAHWRQPAVVVSHDRELLEEMDAIAELRAGELRFYGGNFSAYTEAVAIEQAAAEQAVRAAKGDLRRQQRDLVEARTRLERSQRYGKSQAARGMPKMVANARRNSAQLTAAKVRGGHEADVAAARVELDRALERVRDDDVIKIDLDSTTVPAARDVAVMEDVVLRNHVRVSLHLRGPERVALTGPNGSGKTTLIDTLRGALPPLSGGVTIKVPHQLLPQRLQLLDDDETVLAGVGRYAPTADHHALRAQLARFLLDAHTIQRPVATLSGGERFRASLAALLLAEPPPQLLILDEPTNNLDLVSVAQLTSALRSYRGALLVASHDEPFLADLDLTRRLELGRPPTAGAKPESAESH